MPPLIAIVGKSQSGKTTLLESLVSQLKGRGYRIATIKHSAHGFELDLPGKDSWRLIQAGSDVVALSAPKQFALFQPLERELSLEELPRLLTDGFDLLLAEGFAQARATKIEVHRREQGADLLCPLSQLWALVTDEPLDLSLPQFSLEDAEGLADLIAKTFLASPAKEEVDLFVNGFPIPIGPFVNDVLAKTLLGMVSTLKGVGEVRSLDLRLRRE